MRRSFDTFQILLPTMLLSLAACASDAPTAARAPLAAAVDAAPVPLQHWMPMPGAAAAFDFAVTADGRLLAAGETAGLLTLAPSGPRWQPLAGWPAGTSAVSVAVAPDGAIYVGTDTGVVRSHDGGAHWVPAGLTQWMISQLEIDPHGSVYAGATGNEGGLFRSDDGGLRWTMKYGPLGRRDGIVKYLSVRKGDIVFGSYAQTPMYSRDAGDSWEPLWSLWELPEWAGHAEHVIETSQGNLLVAWFMGIARSEDGGASFKQVHAGFASRLVHDAATGTTYALTGDRAVLRSTDDGRSWQPYAAPVQSDLPETIAIAPDGRLLLGVWNGVWQTVR